MISGILAAAAAQAPAQGADGDRSERAEERVICKSKAKTGTRFKTKTCRTVAQWDQMAEQHRRDAAETIDRPQIEIRRE